MSDTVASWRGAPRREKCGLEPAEPRRDGHGRVENELWELQPPHRGVRAIRTRTARTLPTPYGTMDRSHIRRLRRDRVTQRACRHEGVLARPLTIVSVEPEDEPRGQDDDRHHGEHDHADQVRPKSRQLAHGSRHGAVDEPESGNQHQRGRNGTSCVDAGPGGRLDPRWQDVEEERHLAS